MKIAIVLGTRPEWIKLAPIIKCIQKKDLNYIILFTNQHNKNEMSNVFIDEFDIDISKVKICDEKFEDFRVINWLYNKIKGYDYCIVQGDTNSTLYGAIAARKANVKVVHIEAGLRSYEIDVIEEQNRKEISNIADYHFCPSYNACINLYKESIINNVFIVGNTIVDTIDMSLSRIKNSFVSNLNQEYALLTIHRTENLKSKTQLIKILVIANIISKKHNTNIIFLIHPKTKDYLNKYNIDINKLVKNIIVLKPKSYINFLKLLYNSKLVITDSGGIQEEAYILKKPCFTLREATERPETLLFNNTLICPSLFKKNNYFPLSNILKNAIIIIVIFTELME